MPDYILGIDIGTGSTKAIAMDRSGTILFSTSAVYPTLHPQPGYSEQAPELIWQAFVKCILRTTTQLGTPVSIALSSAMHSVVPVDTLGNPLMNLITWSDNRSASIASRIRKSATGEMIYEQTGTPIHAMAPLSKIIWLKENIAELISRTNKLISIKEYVWFKLFGVFEIDHSIASATGLFDIETLAWNDNSLILADITKDILSNPVSTSHKRKLTNPDITKQLGVTLSTDFIIGASDGCLANLGSFATHPGVAALTIGTSGAIRVSRTKPVFNFQSMPFNYRLDEQVFISGGPINNGGIALKWYAENFLGQPLNNDGDYQKLFQSINDIPSGSDGLLFLPYILGERAPIWNSDACGVFFGMTARHRQAHFTRAVIEGISMSLYQVGLSLEINHITQINVSGGFVRSTEWLQILADIFGKQICLVNSEDASAIGAAYLGMRACGLIKNFDELSPRESKMVYPNRLNHSVYTDDVLPRYERLYKLLKEEMNVLSEQKNNTLNVSN